MTTIAVLVSFHPDPVQLKRNIEALATQVDDIVVVDNSPEKFEAFPISNYIWLPENAGVGRAQNIGIGKAKQLGADKILLSDQDSYFYPNAVGKLAKALDSSEDVAAAGPVYRELNSNQLSSFFKLKGYRCLRTSGAHLMVEETVQTDFLISSGTLMKLSAFEDVGQMREDYFIDYVDTEWCIRAASMGHVLLGVGGEMMAHTLGDGSNRIWFGRWRWVAKHKPERYFYAFRNGVDLLIKRNLPLNWQVYLIRRLVGYFCFLIFLDRRWHAVAWGYRGVITGFDSSNVS